MTRDHSRQIRRRSRSYTLTPIRTAVLRLNLLHYWRSPICTYYYGELGRTWYFWTLIFWNFRTLIFWNFRTLIFWNFRTLIFEHWYYIVWPLVVNSQHESKIRSTAMPAGSAKPTCGGHHRGRGPDLQSRHAGGITEEADRTAKPACQRHQTFISGRSWD